MRKTECGKTQQRDEPLLHCTVTVDVSVEIDGQSLDANRRRDEVDVVKVQTNLGKAESAGRKKMRSAGDVACSCRQASTVQLSTKPKERRLYRDSRYGRNRR